MNDNPAVLLSTLTFSEVSCGLLPPVNFTTNSSTQGDGIYLDQITYNCSTGYQHSSGDLVRNCTSDGTWDGTAPNCTSKVIYQGFCWQDVVLHCSHHLAQGNKKYTFIFSKRPERYNQEVLSYSFICLPLPSVEGIVLMCNIDLYCVIAIYNGTGDMFNR